MSVPDTILYHPMTSSNPNPGVLIPGFVITVTPNNLAPSTPGVIQIESEKFHYQSCDPSNFYGITRAYDGTSAAAHAADVLVSFVASDAQTGPASGIAAEGQVPTADGDGGSTWQDPSSGGSAWGDITGTLSDQTDLQSALDAKEDSLGFTPEDVGNKSTNTSLGTSDTLYPSQKAVKTYVDANAGTQVIPQVIQTVSNAGVQITASTTYVAVGPTVAIALQNAAYKVKISASSSVGNAGTSAGMYTIFRDGVDLLAGKEIANSGAIVGGGIQLPFSIQFIDTPGDTSSHTYQIAYKSEAGGNVYYQYFQSGNGTTVIIAEEILV